MVRARAPAAQQMATKTCAGGERCVEARSSRR